VALGACAIDRTRRGAATWPNLVLRVEFQRARRVSSELFAVSRKPLSLPRLALQDLGGGISEPPVRHTAPPGEWQVLGNQATALGFTLNMMCSERGDGIKAAAKKNSLLIDQAETLLTECFPPANEPCA